MSEIKEIPMLFSQPMVLALLNGTKTETRRLVTFKKEITDYQIGFTAFTGPRQFSVRGIHANGEYGESIFNLKYGQKNDVIWVRETWGLTQPFDPETYYFKYKAYDQLNPHSRQPASSKYDYSTPDKWRTSLHMPREAARLFLQIKSINAEPLQAITPEAAIAEGIEREYDDSGASWYKNYGKTGPSMFKRDPIASYRSLWELINGKGSWDKNPDVWVIKFEKLKQR